MRYDFIEIVFTNNIKGIIDLKFVVSKDNIFSFYHCLSSSSYRI